jgi:hypothetical protein
MAVCRGSKDTGGLLTFLYAALLLLLLLLLLQKPL